MKSEGTSIADLFSCLEAHTGTAEKAFQTMLHSQVVVYVVWTVEQHAQHLTSILDRHVLHQAIAPVLRS